jgi:hypothetical protein
MATFVARCCLLIIFNAFALNSVDVRRSTPEKWFNNPAVSGGLQPYLVWLTISFVLKQWVITVEQLWCCYIFQLYVPHPFSFQFSDCFQSFRRHSLENADSLFLAVTSYPSVSKSQSQYRPFRFEIFLTGPQSPPDPLLTIRKQKFAHCEWPLLSSNSDWVQTQRSSAS